MSELIETWKPVPGLGSDRYEVSDHGRVRHLYKTREPRILTPSPAGRRGHVMVSVYVSNERKVWTVHRLVMAAFVGPLPPGLQTRHLNGDPTDNRLSNLKYGTQSENMRDAVRHGTHNNASKTHCRNGHPFTPENTGVQWGGSGRFCKRCATQSALRRAREKRAEGYCSPCSVSYHATCKRGRCVCTRCSTEVAA